MGQLPVHKQVTRHRIEGRELSTNTTTTDNLDNKPLTSAEQETWDSLHALMALDGDSQIDAITTFLTDRTAVWHSQARRLCNRFSLDVTIHVREVAQMMWETAWSRLLAIMEDPEIVDTLTSFEAHVYVSSLNQVRQYADVSASHGMTGYQGVRRRNRALLATRKRLTSILQREPTDQEVVDAYNEHMRKSRKDPERQGVLADLTDLYPTWWLSADLMTNLSNGSPTVVGGSTPTESVLDAHSRMELRNAVVAELVSRDEPKAAKFAAWWLSQFEDGGPAETRWRLAQESGYKAREVDLFVPLVHEVSKQILADQFDITGH